MLLWRTTGEKLNEIYLKLANLCKWNFGNSMTVEKELSSKMDKFGMKTFSCCLPEKAYRSSERQKQPWKFKKASIESPVTDVPAATIWKTEPHPGFFCKSGNFAVKLLMMFEQDTDIWLVLESQRIETWKNLLCETFLCETKLRWRRSVNS